MNFPMAKSTNRPHQQAEANKKGFSAGNKRNDPFRTSFFWLGDFTRQKTCSNCHDRNCRVFLPSINVSPTVKTTYSFDTKKSEPPMHRAVGKKQKNYQKVQLMKAFRKKHKFRGDTPRKINMEPKNHPIERNIIFQTVPC